MSTRFFEPAEPDASKGRPSSRVALVVGNGAYDKNPLANPARDAEVVGRALQAVGFDTTIRIDADMATLKEAIVEFGERIERAGKDAIAFFYFAGHGVEDQGINYMVPIGTNIRNTRYLKSGAIPVEDLVEEFVDRKSRANLIVLDACRDNRLASHGGGLLKGMTTQKLKRLPNGTIVAYATAAGAVAEDGPGRNSPYASALALRLCEPGRRIDELFFLVAHDVATATSEQQQPALYVQGAVPPLLLREQDNSMPHTPAEAAAPPPPPPPPPAAADPAPPNHALNLEAVAKRQLNVFFLVDCSGSMAGARINSLNMAMRMAVPELRKAALTNPFVDVLVKVLRFADGAAWQTEEAVPAADFDWPDLAAAGDTDMGAAFELIADVLPRLSARARQFPPVIVLITDGFPSDDFEPGLKALLSSSAGAKAVRVAIAIGEDADHDVLRAFINDARFEPLEAGNVTELMDRIRWVSSALVSQHSQGLDPEKITGSEGQSATPSPVQWVW